MNTTATNETYALVHAEFFWTSLGVSRSLFYKMVANGEIPEGFKKDYPRQTSWFKYEVSEYVRQFAFANSSIEYQNITKNILLQRALIN